jgi:hypothetical protein
VVAARSTSLNVGVSFQLRERSTLRPDDLAVF